MTYPVLRLTKDYALVEVRKGRGAMRWRDMAPVFAGPANAGQEWQGGEGEKLCAKHCRWPTDPNSGLSLRYCAAGHEGLGTGKPALVKFP